jgi:alanine racemase
MNRYGFNADEIDLLVSKLEEYSHLKIESICSHLATSNDKSKDAFTQKQFKKFDIICKTFSKKLNITPKKHILNTAGVLRFPKQQKEMVRLGIGLYGIGGDKQLNPIGKLVSNVAQIRTLKKGGKVGYDSFFVAEKEMKIAIIPLGYADGINRKLGDGKGKVLINNASCSIIGKISMDSFMIDISGTNAKEGDLVTIFSKENLVVTIAKNLDTIAYEILATLNRRIKRVYH